jgi:hypothetical protein
MERSWPQSGYHSDDRAASRNKKFESPHNLALGVASQATQRQINPRSWLLETRHPSLNSGQTESLRHKQSVTLGGAL